MGFNDVMMPLEFEQQLKFENAFQKVLINLATRFINYPVDQMDHAITESLRQIVEFLGGLRASIYEFNEERCDFSLLYHWVAPDNQRVFQTTLAVARQSSTVSILMQGNVITIPDRDEMPVDDPLKQIFADLGANAGILVPILREGKLLSIISTSWSKPREIQSEISDLLRVVGEIFLNAMDRKEHEDRIRGLNEALEARVAVRTKDLLSTNEQLENEIVERKQVEADLRTSQERYRIITEIISDDAYLCHVEAAGNLRIEWINQETYAHLTGYQAEEIPQLFQAYHPDDQALAHQDIERVLQGHATEREYRIVAKDGEIHWVSTRRYPVWDKDQQRVVQFYGVAQDITERKRAEEALRISEERYRLVTEIISDFAFLYRAEPDGTLKPDWVTEESYRRLTGFAVGETGHPFGMYHSEDQASAQAGVTRTLQGNSTEGEYRILTKDGNIRWIYMRRFPLWDAKHERVDRFYGVAQDITERKQTEKALRVSEERYRLVTELISDYAFLYRVESDGSLMLEWMTADPFARLTGYSVEEIGEPYGRYHPDDEAIAREDVQLVLQGHSIKREYRIITKGGETRWIYMRRDPLWDEQHERVIRFYGVAQDITERKQIEAEEHEQRVLAEALLDTADALNSTLDLEDIFDRILTNVERVAPHDAGMIMLIESGEARVVRAKGGKTADWRAAVENTIYPLATTPNLRHIFETGQPLIIPDVQEYASWVDVPINDWIRSHFCIPLRQGEEVVGFLSCESGTPGFFSPKMLTQLQAFAHQTASAITNARLYQQGQELAVLQERQRLARDLHDAVTQTMFSTSMIAETMLRVWDTEPEQVREGLTQLRYMTRGAVAEMRSLLYELRPEALESMSLSKLIRQVAEAFGGKSGIIPSVFIEGDRSLPQDVKITLYRIAQESLNNVSKHARASAVSVSLSTNAVVELVVSDNGRGFTPEQAKSGSLGLKIMRERVEKIGAALTLQSEPGKGTIIRVEWVG